jgi:ACS family glucarate transporter-like MFS transporter
MHGPRQHPQVTPAELTYIAAGGALVDLDNDAVEPQKALQWRQLKQLLSSRMLVGVYIGQYCITTLT